MNLMGSKTQDPLVMETVLEGLRTEASELGMVLSGWDAAGTMMSDPVMSNEFCRLVCTSNGSCEKARCALVSCVLRNGAPSHTIGPLGCCLLGIPVRNRHRLAGALVLEYPTREMLDEEHLARLCDRLQLDRQVIAAHARNSCRYSAAEAPSLQRVFTMLLEDRQQKQETNHALISLSMSLANAYEELSLLYRISGSMRVSQEPHRFLQEVCDQLLDVMNLDMSAAVMLDAETKLNHDSVIKAGLESVSPQQIRLLVVTHITPNLQNETDVLLENRFDGGGEVFFGKEVRNLLAVPLISDRRIIGVLLGLNKHDGDFDSFDAKLIGSIANQSSVFLANHHMYAELQDLLMGVLQSLTESIDAKDPYTCGHSRRVAEISHRLAIGCKFSPEEVQNIYLAGLLHDVGKIGVPEVILCKEGRLTDEEYDIMKRHPGIGAKILGQIRNFEPIISGVLSHHERLDGGGYPNGLRDQDIPMEGKIIGLADSWDAMTSQRTYRGAMSLEEAVEEVKKCAGTQFDPMLVDIFLSWDPQTLTNELSALSAQPLYSSPPTKPSGIVGAEKPTGERLILSGLPHVTTPPQAV